MRFLKLSGVLAVAVLGLSACEGYEMVKVDNVFPYGNERTAGSGVAYVLARMMSEKDMKVEMSEASVERKRELEIVPTPTIELEAKPVVDTTKADELFAEKSSK